MGFDSAEIRSSSIDEYQKSQDVRLIDIFFIAPILIYAGLYRGELNKWVRLVLIIIGIATLYYNAKNFIINEKQNHD
jgi:hypothetical protein